MATRALVRIFPSATSSPPLAAFFSTASSDGTRRRGLRHARARVGEVELRVARGPLALGLRARGAQRLAIEIGAAAVRGRAAARARGERVVAIVVLLPQRRRAAGRRGAQTNNLKTLLNLLILNYFLL